MSKRGARSTERGRERTSSAPGRPSLAPLTRSVPLASSPGDSRISVDGQPKQRNSNPIAQPAELARDERESRLFDEFFSWPPPPVDYTPPPFERPRMTREARRAMWATWFMLGLALVGFGSFLAYQELVMPPPAALSQADALQSFQLPTPILDSEISAATDTPRSDFRAHLATAADLAREAEETAAALAADEEPESVKNSADPPPSASAASPAPEAASPQLAAAARPVGESSQPAAAKLAAPGDSPRPSAAATSTASATAPQQLAAAERTRPAMYAPPQPSQNTAPASARTPSVQSAQPTAASAPADAPDDNASFDTLVASARQLFAQGQAKQALLAYDRALGPRPHAIEALLGKAAALFALKDYDAARSTAQEAIALEPNNRDGLLLIGSTWEQLGNKAAAKDTYQRCVDQASETHSAPCRQRLAQLDAQP